MLYRIGSTATWCLGIAIVVAVPVVASAQPAAEAFNALGFQKNHNYFSPEPFEHYDTVSGNVLLTFTDLTLPSNGGRSLQFQRTYNNQPTTAYDKPSRWSFGFPGVVMHIWEQQNDSLVGINFNDDIRVLKLFAPSFITADGAVHPTIFSMRPDTTNAQTVANTTRMVISGEFYKYDRDSRLLYMPDGTVCHYEDDYIDSLGRPVLSLDWFDDPFGNRVALARQGTTLTVTQDLRNDQSRAIVLTLEGRRVRSMIYEGRVWQYDYVGTDISVVTPPPPEGPGSPTGPEWTFSYASGSGVPPDLTRITTPHGGRIDYTWTDVFVQTGPLPSDGFTRHFLESRESYDRDSTLLGRWTLAWGNQGGPAAWGTVITTPSGTPVQFLHGELGAEAKLLAGGFGVTGRYTAGESESITHRVVPVVKYSTTAWFGTPEIAQRTITRGTRTYTTQYEYPLDTAAFPWAYHRPTKIIDNNNEGFGRTTTRTYENRPSSPSAPSPTTSEPYILGLPVIEDVTVSTETFRRQWLYDATGFMTHAFAFAKIGAGVIATLYTRGDFGNVFTVTSGASMSYSYSWGVPSEIQAGEYTINREINSDGTIQWEERGTRRTTFTYDAWMRPRVVQPPGGTNPTLTTYDIDGANVTVTRGASSLRTSFDGFGRPIGTVNSLGVNTSIRYDPEGRVTYRSLPFRDTADVGTRIEYDALDRVTRETVHDREHNVDGVFRQYTYGPDTATIHDEEGRVTVQRYVAFGHPDDARLAQVTDAKQQTWGYAHNALGKLRTVTAPDGIVRTWDYNDQNLLWREVQPESGITTHTYYLSGLPLQKTDANGKVFTYFYDTNDRLKSIRVGTTTTTTIQYEPHSDEPQSIITPNGSTTFVYDAAGRPQERKDVIGAYVFFSHYVHDENDNLVEITYPSQRTIRFSFDSEHQVTRVFEPEVPRDYASGITYHPSGALASYTAGNGIQTTIAYDQNRYWVRNISAGTVQFSYDNYDGVGNVRTITDSRPGGMTQQLTYDELDRLQTVTGPLTAVYAYDVHGNRADANGATYIYEPTGTLRLESRSGVSYTYDANGNTKTIGGTTFTYTPENWLASATIPGGTRTYKYDSDGWRTRKTVPGENTFYVRGLGQEVLTEWHYTSTSTRARDYIYAGGRLLSAVDRLTTLPGGCGGAAGPDGTNPITISTPGGSASVTFEGSGCRRASVLVTKTGGNIGCVTIDIRLVSNNTLVGSASGLCTTTAFLEPVVLPVAGDYRVTVTAGSGSGTATVQIYDVVDVEMPIASDGLPIPVDLLNPGQITRLPFTGTADQRVSVLVNVATGGFGCWKVEVWRVAPNSRVSPAYSTCVSGGPGFLEPFALPADAAYYVVVDPSVQNTGTAGVHLYDVVDVATPIAADGTPVPIDLTVPGRKTWMPFSGSANQKVSVLVTVSSGGFGCWPIEIWRVSTNSRVSPVYSTCVSAGPGFLEPFALPADGEYRVVVNPSMSSTGTGIAKLYTVTDVNGAITPNGGAMPLTLAVPGQAGRLTFNGLATYKATIPVTVTSGSFGCWSLTLLQPNNTPLQSWSQCTGNVTRGPVTLPTAGIYTIVVDPGMSNTGTANISLSLVP